jgi:hypothetical protein
MMIELYEVSEESKYSGPCSRYHVSISPCLLIHFHRYLKNAEIRREGSGLLTWDASFGAAHCEGLDERFFCPSCHAISDLRLLTALYILARLSSLFPVSVDTSILGRGVLRKRSNDTRWVDHHLGNRKSWRQIDTQPYVSRVLYELGDDSDGSGRSASAYGVL